MPIFEIYAAMPINLSMNVHLACLKISSSSSALFITHCPMLCCSAPCLNSTRFFASVISSSSNMAHTRKYAAWPSLSEHRAECWLPFFGHVAVNFVLWVALLASHALSPRRRMHRHRTGLERPRINLQVSTRLYSLQFQP